LALFIVFEGGDGSGKSAQARHLYGLLCQNRVKARMIREPGSTALGEQLRSLISLPREALAATWSQPGAGAKRSVLVPPRAPAQLAAKELWFSLSAEAELFLFLAARAQLAAEVIRPTLARGIAVICDRYIYSTVAYQGYGRGLDVAFLKDANRAATGGLEPDLVVLLDIEPSRGLDRKRKDKEVTRFEEEQLEFHQRVRRGYLEQAAADPQRWLVVDASQPRKEVGQRVWERVQPMLGAG